MPFEFAFLDWLYQFRNPVMNAISIFFEDVYKRQVLYSAVD